MGAAVRNIVGTTLTISGPSGWFKKMGFGEMVSNWRQMMKAGDPFLIFLPVFAKMFQEGRFSEFNIGSDYTEFGHISQQGVLTKRWV